MHPDAMSLDALRERAWAVMEPHYLTRLAGLIEMFGAARAKELGDDDIEKVAVSAVAARVGTLLTETDRHVPGRIDPEQARSFSAETPSTTCSMTLRSWCSKTEDRW